MEPIAPRGLHHITCVCNDWQRTVAYYEAIGFHLVKNTVNHDAPETRHVYLADRAGTPGTVITFFEWPSERRGVPGFASAHHVNIELPSGLSLEGARARLEERATPSTKTTDQGHACLEVRDPDGLMLRLVEGTGEGPRLRSAALYGAVEERVTFLRDVLGLDVKHAPGGDLPPRVVAPQDRLAFLLLDGATGPGRIAPGAVHHIALAVEPDEQRKLRDRLVDAGYSVTEPIDRVYFRSVYTRDPGGHILELATMAPGFAVDEPEDELGRKLVLPEWLEGKRAEIERALTR